MTVIYGALAVILAMLLSVPSDAHLHLFGTHYLMQQQLSDDLQFSAENLLFPFIFRL